MYSSISEYAYVNTRIRVLLSLLLDEKTFENLIGAKDVFSICEILKETSYKNIIENFEKEGFNIHFFEKNMLKQDIDMIKKMYNSVFSISDRNIISLLIQKYEIKELKIALRLWHKKNVSDASKYLLGEKLWFDIDFNRIVSSPDLNNILQILEKTYYRQSLEMAKNLFEEKNSIFFLESSLDKIYFEKITSSINRFLLTDRITLSKIIGAEIDIENINWMIRAKKYYSLEREEINNYLIKGGNITKSEFIDSFLSGEIKSIYNISLTDIFEKNEYMLEISLNEILLNQIKQILSGFPFTIGIILSYVILKTREIKNIISIINAKNYGLAKEEISVLIGQ